MLFVRIASVGERWKRRKAFGFSCVLALVITSLHGNAGVRTCWMYTAFVVLVEKGTRLNSSDDKTTAFFLEVSYELRQWH